MRSTLVDRSLGLLGTARLDQAVLRRLLLLSQIAVAQDRPDEDAACEAISMNDCESRNPGDVPANDSVKTEWSDAGQPSLVERRFWWLVTALCLLAALTRLLIISEYVAENPFASGPRVDAKVYWNWAGDIADGRMTQDVPFFSAPLYPYLLGLLRSLGGGLTSVCVIQSLLDLLTACILARVCRRRFGAASGLLAAGLFLFMQEPASFSLRVLTCSLQLTLLALTWDRLVAVQAKPTWGRRLAVGAAVGFLCLSYPPAMLLVPATGLWLFWQSQRRLTDALLAAVPAGLACLIIAPATLHNVIAGKSFFLIQGATAINLCQGNTPGADGTYTPIPNTTLGRENLFRDVARQYRLATGRTGTWNEIDRFYRDQVFAFWRSDPAGAAALAARKAYWFLTGRVYGDIYVPALEIGSGFADRLCLAPIHTAWLIGPAIVALVILLRRPIRYAPELLMFAIPFMLVTVFWYSPRYRMSALPLIIGLAAWALCEVARRRSHPVLSVAAVCALLLGVALGPINRARGFDTAEVPAPWYEVSVGVRFEETGDTVQARHHYERALQLCPGDPGALSHLAKLAFEEGRADEAVHLLKMAITVSPTIAWWHGNLGRALESQGRHEEAISAFEQALELDPALIDIHIDLGTIYSKLRQPDKAIEHWRAALKKDPAFLNAHFSLAMLFERTGRAAEAEAQYRSAAEAVPRNADARIKLFEFYVRFNRPRDGEAVLRDALIALPDNSQMQSALAWLYATVAQDDVRDGQEAVRLAERVCRATQRQNAEYLDVLAAAYAEAGRFREAVATQQETIRLARRQGITHALPVLQHRLRLYQDGQPFHWGQ